MISDAQKAANAAGAIATGLLSLIIPVPLTTVQWANKHYYLPKESSYTPGRWETLPFQVGIMNCMGNDLIRTVSAGVSAADSGESQAGTGQCSREVCFRSEDIRDERESVGNPCRIFRNVSRIVRQFGGIISIIGVSFKR